MGKFLSDREVAKLKYADEAAFHQKCTRKSDCPPPFPYHKG